MSKKIESVDFENWTAACAHLAGGMSEEEVLKILGVDSNAWQRLNTEWTEQLKNMITNDPEAATTYGNIFANPKVGKFT